MGVAPGPRGVRVSQRIGALGARAGRQLDDHSDHRRFLERAAAGRGLWATGAFGVRALTQAAALELRPHQIHVALLVVDARIDRSGTGDASSADPGSLADAVAYLASQNPRAMTHELQVTPALDNWSP